MNKLLYFLTLIVGILAYLYFDVLVKTVATDIHPHSEQVQNINNGIKNLPPNFLYYTMVWLLSGFSADLVKIKGVSIIILAISIALKFGVTQYIIKDYLKHSFHKILTNSQLYIIYFLSVLLILVFTIPDAWYYASHRQFYYLGRLVPNVWHNSTIIFLMPFALLLFWEQYCILFFDKKINFLRLSLLIFINIVIKPSFFFIYLMVTPFFLLYIFRFKKEFWQNIYPILFGGILILLQTYLIFVLKAGLLVKDETSIEISSAFKVWQIFMPEKYIFNGLLNTFALPMGFIILFAKNIYKSPKLAIFVTSLGFAAVLLFCFVAEGGERMVHGNFFWQCIVASYIIFMAVVMESLKIFFSPNATHKWRFLILAILLALHVGSGCFYLSRILEIKSYL